MKTHFAATTAALLLAGTAWAGPEGLIKQHAKELRDQNNVRQGVPPPTQPPATATPGSAVPATPVPSLAPGLLKFQTDLATVKPESPATAQLKQQLAGELLAGALTAGKPTPAQAAKFVDGVAAASAEKALSATSRARLVQELDAVLNPGKYPQAQLGNIFADIQAIFQANGLSRSKATAIGDEVKAISAEVMKGAK